MHVTGDTAGFHILASLQFTSVSLLHYCSQEALQQIIYKGGLQVLLAVAPALHCHNHSVRVLAAGRGDTLISGDAGGEMAIWAV